MQFIMTCILLHTFNQPAHYQKTHTIHTKRKLNLKMLTLNNLITCKFLHVMLLHVYNVKLNVMQSDGNFTCIKYIQVISRTFPND